MMMGQLSQRTLSVIAGKNPSHPEVQGHRLHNSPCKSNSEKKNQNPSMTRKQLFKASYED